MTPAVIHVLFVLAQAQRIAPTHLQAFPGLKRFESSRICVSPTGMEAKKNTLGTMMQSTTSWWVTQIFKEYTWSLHNAFARLRGIWSFLYDKYQLWKEYEYLICQYQAQNLKF